MLWYGKPSKIRAKTVFKRKNHLFNVKTRRIAFSIKKHTALAFRSLMFYVPTNWNVVLLKSFNLNSPNYLIYIYSDIYYFKVAVGDFLSLWEFNIPTNTFYIRNPFTCPFTPFYFNRLRDIFSSFAVLFFAKLKIKGKGYYIYKNYRNTITHQFGHSHRVFIYAYFVTVRFLSKTVVLLFGSSKRDVFTIGNNVQSSKYLNIFTGRGVRFSKQVIYKKTGKVSAYR